MRFFVMIETIAVNASHRPILAVSGVDFELNRFGTIPIDPWPARGPPPFSN
jgi:hypothetical protein